ncbi:hypothetical protein QJS66_09215 [Kocuria rhizophila]|nr:hypothetical protein QJS66_09215 [Kocuria rhizophila]
MTRAGRRRPRSPRHPQERGVCGEAAADPALAVVLVGLGVDSPSMSARSAGRGGRGAEDRGHGAGPADRASADCGPRVRRRRDARAELPAPAELGCDGPRGCPERNHPQDND